MRAEENSATTPGAETGSTDLDRAEEEERPILREDPLAPSHRPSGRPHRHVHQSTPANALSQHPAAIHADRSSATRYFFPRRSGQTPSPLPHQAPASPPDDR